MSTDIFERSFDPRAHSPTNYLAVAVRVFLFALYLTAGVLMMIAGYGLIQRSNIILNFVPGNRGGYNNLAAFNPLTAIPGVASLSYGFMIALISVAYLIGNRFFYQYYCDFVVSVHSPERTDFYKFFARILLNLDIFQNKVLSAISLFIVYSNFIALCVVFFTFIIVIMFSNSCLIPVGFFSVLIFLKILTLLNSKSVSKNDNSEDDQADDGRFKDS